MVTESGEFSDLVLTSEFFSSVKNIPKEKEADLVSVLKMFAPGTALRTAVDDILRANMGALIVINKEGLDKIIDGGFRLNCKFSSQRLVELAKMDGAIVVSEDIKKILYSNALLSPNVKLKTKETGTRHKAAERTAKQFGAIVVAVSERKRKITLYWGDEKYILEPSSEILRRAMEILQILEKQREIFNDLLSNLNVLEITNLVTINDVCSLLQRMEMIKRISDIVKRYLIELGKEGLIISMRLKELTKNISKERELILKDYFGSKYFKVDNSIEIMNLDFLLELSNLSRILFEELHDKPVSPRGFRILSKTNLLEKDIKILVSNFDSLDKIFDADKDALIVVLKNEDLVTHLREDLESLREKILAGKRI